MQQIQKKSKYGFVVLVATILVQLTIGVAYIWSAFQTDVSNFLFNSNAQLSSLTFSLMLAFLSISSIFGGKLAQRFSTRKIVIIGGIILGVGFIVSGFVRSNFSWLLWISYGLLGGVGMGFTYTTTIACTQKWFPTKKGLVTGIVVAALGLGTVVFVPLVNFLIARFAYVSFGGYGFGGSVTFMILGGIMLVVCVVGGIFMKNPATILGEEAQKEKSLEDLDSVLEKEQQEEMTNEFDALLTGDLDQEEKEYVQQCYSDTLTFPPYGVTPSIVKIKKPRKSEFEKRELNAIQMLRTPYFYLVFFAFMLASVAGLMVINFADPIATGMGFIDTAFIAILAVGLSNAGGRLLWGFISDKLGRINTIFILLGISAILAPFVLMVNNGGVFALIALIGLCYGGILAIFPPLTSELFGTKNLATNYGVVLVGFGVGAIVAGQVAGVFSNAANISNQVTSMAPAFYIAAGCSVLAALLLLVAKLIARKKRHTIIKNFEM